VERDEGRKKGIRGPLGPRGAIRKRRGRRGRRGAHRRERLVLLRCLRPAGSRAPLASRYIQTSLALNFLSGFRDLDTVFLAPHSKVRGLSKCDMHMFSKSVIIVGKVKQRDIVQFFFACKQD